LQNIETVSKGKNYHKHAKAQNKFIIDFQFPASRQAGVHPGALAVREKKQPFEVAFRCFAWNEKLKKA
jgi:hypothetical protein